MVTGHPGPDGAAQGRRARLWELGPEELWSVALRTLRAAATDRITTGAASLAFHWFLAIFPAAIAALGVTDIVGLSPSGLHNLVHDTEVLLPAQAASIIDQAVRNPSAARPGVAGVVVGSLVAIWSSVESMASLQVGLDIAYEAGSDRGFVGRRIMALPLLGATLVLGGAAFALVVLGQPLSRLLLHSQALSAAANAARIAGALALVLLLLSCYYALGPNRSPRRWEWITPGGVLAAAGWLAASAGFSWYLTTVGHETRTYGAFAGVAILLLWLFLTALAVLLGAELNRELERTEAARQVMAG